MAIDRSQFDPNSVNKDPSMPTMVRRLRNIYEATPDEVREAGMNWYGSVHDAVQKAVAGTGRSVLHGAGVVAAVSPNMDWERNNINAFDELSSLSGRQWNAVRRSAGTPGVRTDEASDALRGLSISSSNDRNLMKAHRIWVAGEDPEAVLPRKTAPKTNSFMHNIASPQVAGYVTSDGRHSDILADAMRPWEYDRGISTAQSKRGAPTRYERYSDATSAAARGAGILPHEMQAIVWEQGKRIERGFDPARKKGDVRAGQSYQKRQKSFLQGAGVPSDDA